MSAFLDVDLTLPLDRFSLRVEWQSDERTLGVFGASGSGKTSLLEAIAGLRRAVRGRIRIGGRTWLDSERGEREPPERRGVGYVPQDARLFPHLDVGGNLRMGRRRAERAPGARLDPERVLELLELRGRDRDDIASLSGGERQRVALGRALCAGPDLLLLDEPLGALDQPLRRRILPYLVRVEREFGVPSILVSHDPTEVRLMCRDAIVLIDGRVAAHGRPDDILAGREMRARLGVAGHTNILRGTVLSIDGDVATVGIGGGHRIASPAPPDIATGESVAVLVHAEELIVATESPLALSAQNILPGTVRAASGEPATAEGGKGEGSVTLAVDVAGLTTPLLAAVTAYSYRRLGLAASRLVFLVWKTHACRAVPAGSRSEENLA